MKDWIHTQHFNAQAHALGYHDFEEAIRDLYSRGVSLTQIAAMLEMSNMGVWRHLHQLQITPRPRGGWHTKRPRIVITYQGREYTTSQLAAVLGTYRELALKMVRAGRLPGARFEKRIAT